MPYIIENANILKNDQCTTNSLLIKDNRIAHMKPSFHMNHMKMDASSFILTRPHVIFDQRIPYTSHVQADFKRYILKGCTTLVTCFAIDYESEFAASLQEHRQQLACCPLDYVIGVKIPLRLLTPTFIRTCKKEKIPVIFIELDDVNGLKDIAWGWIREAMFPYYPPLVPLFHGENVRAVEEKRLVWDKVMRKEQIPSHSTYLENEGLVPDDMQRKIGLFPIKGNIHHGAEVSYNLYGEVAATNIVDESQLFLYYNNRLKITVHKGKVIRAGENVNYQSGYGEEVEITTPAFFSTPI